MFNDLDYYKNLPRIDPSTLGKFDYLIILPPDELHDSGFNCTAFFPVKDGVTLGRIGGGSDVIHIDGIGGYGISKGFMVNDSAEYKEPRNGIAWSIDCLPCGLLRIFPSSCYAKMVCDSIIVSSFCIYAVSAND